MPGTEAISVNLPKRSHGLLPGINGLSFTQSPDLSIRASPTPRSSRERAGQHRGFFSKPLFHCTPCKNRVKKHFFFFFPGAATLSRPGEKGRISQKGVTNKRWTQLPELPHGQLARAVLLPDFRLNSLVSWRHEVRSPALFYVVMVNLLVLLFGCQGRTLRLGMAV